MSLRVNRDGARGRVQDQSLRHCCREDDPLCRVCELLVSASERVTGNGRTKL
ncbi:MAG: hypothetical protein OXB92_13000 [Acidimicrobiaceae bacterium]|nr:hypothetical protein [Acidimicrobiia bacterium]MCY4494767.1 hypothetical protein [Acidimicrobiaceae bacterium]